MAAGAYDGRERVGPVLRQVKVGRNEEAGATFVNEFLNVIFIAFNDTNDAGIEGRFLLRERSKARMNPFPDIRNIRFGISLRFESRLAGKSASLRADDLVQVVVVHHPWKAIERRQILGRRIIIGKGAQGTELLSGGRRADKLEKTTAGGGVLIGGVLHFGKGSVLVSMGKWNLFISPVHGDANALGG
jgi:hypothetical protein